MLVARGLPDRLVPFADTPAEAAATPTYLAAAPGVAPVSGEYFVDREPTEPSSAARRPGAADDLWELSRELTGLTWE